MWSLPNHVRNTLVFLRSTSAFVCRARDLVTRPTRSFSRSAAIARQRFPNEGADPVPIPGLQDHRLGALDESKKLPNDA